MLVINKEHVKHVAQKIRASGITEEVLGNVEKMLEIKEVLLWRADTSSCCGVYMRGIMASLESEIELLKAVLSALEHNETAQAIDLLNQYEHLAGVKYR